MSGITARSVKKAAGKGTSSTATHSIRTPNDTWARAQARAARDGVVMNRAIVELLEGYARGVYRLPKKQVEVVRTYVAPSAVPATPTESSAAPVDLTA